MREIDGWTTLPQASVTRGMIDVTA
jgi:hypothetical protein